jgi:PAS domain S-box-containing protein
MFSGGRCELLFVNPASEGIYGLPRAELEDNPAVFLEAIHPDDVPAVKHAMGLLSEGTPVDIEYRVNPGEDYNRWVWVQAEPITVDGEVVRITGFTKDVTDRRRRERQLVVMDNLLRHNLRNDLNVILGSAETLESDVPDTAEYTAVIRRVGEQLLETAEKERGIIELITGRQEEERIELDALIADCVAAVRDRPEGTVRPERDATHGGLQRPGQPDPAVDPPGALDRRIGADTVRRARTANGGPDGQLQLPLRPARRPLRPRLRERLRAPSSRRASD